MAKKKADKKTDKESPETGPKKKGIAGLLGGILTPLIMGGVAFGAVYLLPSSDTSHEEMATEDVHETSGNNAEAYSKPDIETTITALTQMTLSINDNQNILRINIALETPTENVEELDPGDPRLRDAFLGYLRAVNVAQLEEASFMPQLRQQLLRRSRLVLGQDNVSAVLITDFLIR